MTDPNAPFYPTDLTSAADPTADPNYDPLADPNVADTSQNGTFLPPIPLGAGAATTPAALSALGQSGGDSGGSGGSLFDQYFGGFGVGSSNYGNVPAAYNPPPIAQPQAPKPVLPIPFLGDLQRQLPDDARVAVNTAAESLLPATAGFVGSIPGRLAGAWAGAQIGGEAGAVVGTAAGLPEAGVGEVATAPIGAAIGGVVGGIAGMLAAQGLATGAQDSLLHDWLGDSYDQWKQQVAQEQAQHPLGATAGSLIPQLIAFRPDPRALSTAVTGATRALSGDGIKALVQIGADGAPIMDKGLPVMTKEGAALWNVVFGGATQAGLSAMQQIQQGSFQPIDFAVSVLSGTLLNHPTTLGRFLMGELRTGENVRNETSPPAAEGLRGPSTFLEPDLAAENIRSQALQNPAAQAAQEAMLATDAPVHIVGGAVRNSLSAVNPKDLDYTYGGSEAELVAALEEAKKKNPELTFQQTGEHFPVYRVQLGGSEVEIALHRVEDPTDTNKFISGKDVPIQDDLSRRDFSINGMALDMRTGQVVDPHGGLDDLRSNTLRTLSPTSFQADPARMLRALRFVGEGYRLDDATMQQLKDNAPLLGTLKAERKQAELDRVFGSKDPAAALQIMADTGVLEHIFPGLEEMVGFDQKNPHHNLTLWNHSIEVVRNLKKSTNDPDVLLAGFLHDIGKLRTQEFLHPEDPGRASYHGHEDQSAKWARQLLAALKYPTDRIDRVVWLAQNHMFKEEQVLHKPGRFVNKVSEGLSGHAEDVRLKEIHSRIDDLMNIRQADRLSHAGVDDSNVDQMRARLGQEKLEKPAVNGNEIMAALGIEGGKPLGEIIKQLKLEVADKVLPNEREALLNRAKEIYAAQQAPVDLSREEQDNALAVRRSVLAGTIGDLRQRNPAEVRLGKFPGDVRRTVDGKSFSELPPAELGPQLQLRTQQLTKTVNDAMSAVGDERMQAALKQWARIGGAPNGALITWSREGDRIVPKVNPGFLTRAVGRSNDQRYWYERFVEALGDNGSIRGLSDKEKQDFIEILAVTSQNATVMDNFTRALAYLSDQIAGRPTFVDLLDQRPMKRAVENKMTADDAKTMKTSNFAQTFLHVLGLNPEPPLSVNDVWIGRALGLKDSTRNATGSPFENPNLYDWASKLHINLADLANTQKWTTQPWRPWQVQSILWHESGGKQSFTQAVNLIGSRMEAVGIPVARDANGNYVLTREAIADQRTPAALRPAAGKTPPIFTMEAGTQNNPTGDLAHKLYYGGSNEGEQGLLHFDTPQSRALRTEYNDILVKAMSNIVSVRDGKEFIHPLDELISAITRKLTTVARQVRGVEGKQFASHGTWNGIASPNFRIPLALQDSELRKVLAFMGNHFQQGAVAASRFRPVAAGEEPVAASAFFPKDHLTGDEVQQLASHPALMDNGHDLQHRGHVSGDTVYAMPQFEGEPATFQKLLTAVKQTFPGRKANWQTHGFDSTYIDNSEYSGILDIARQEALQQDGQLQGIKLSKEERTTLDQHYPDELSKQQFFAGQVDPSSGVSADDAGTLQAIRERGHYLRLVRAETLLAAAARGRDDQLKAWSERARAHLDNATDEVGKRIVESPNANLEAQQAAREYTRSAGLPRYPDHARVAVDESRSTRIANYYHDAPTDIFSPEADHWVATEGQRIFNEYAQDPVIAPLIQQHGISDYRQLAQASFETIKPEIAAQFKALPVKVEFVTGNPYTSSGEMMHDVRENHTLKVYKSAEDQSGAGGPLMEKSPEGIPYNDLLRAVHDYFGHAAEGHQFGPRGEEGAWVEHSKMFSPLAQLALTTETRGQNSWVNFFNGHPALKQTQRPFADQKTFIAPPEFTDFRSVIGEASNGVKSPEQRQAAHIVAVAKLPKTITLYHGTDAAAMQAIQEGKPKPTLQQITNRVEAAFDLPANTVWDKVMHFPRHELNYVSGDAERASHYAVKGGAFLDEDVLPAIWKLTHQNRGSYIAKSETFDAWKQQIKDQLGLQPVMAEIKMPTEEFLVRGKFNLNRITKDLTDPEGLQYLHHAIQENMDAPLTGGFPREYINRVVGQDHFHELIGAQHGIQQEATRNAEEGSGSGQVEHAQQGSQAEQASQASERTALPEQSTGEAGTVLQPSHATARPDESGTGTTGELTGSTSGATDATTGASGNAARDAGGNAPSRDASSSTDGASAARAGIVHPASARNATDAATGTTGTAAGTGSGTRDAATGTADATRSASAEANASPADVASGSSSATQQRTAQIEQATSARNAGGTTSSDITRNGITVTGVAPRHEPSVNALLDRIEKEGINKNGLIKNIEIVSHLSGGAKGAQSGKGGWEYSRPDTVQLHLDTIKDQAEIRAELQALTDRVMDLLHTQQGERELTAQEQRAVNRGVEYITKASQWTPEDWVYSVFAHEYYHAQAAARLGIRTSLVMEHALAYAALPDDLKATWRAMGMEGQLKTVEDLGVAMDRAIETGEEATFGSDYVARLKQATYDLFEYLGFDLQAIDGTSPFPYNLATDRSFHETFSNAEGHEASQAATAAWRGSRPEFVSDTGVHPGPEAAEAAAVRAAAAPDRGRDPTAADQARIADTLLAQRRAKYTPEQQATQDRTREAAALPRKAKESEDAWLQRVAVKAGFADTEHAVVAIQNQDQPIYSNLLKLVDKPESRVYKLGKLTYDKSPKELLDGAHSSFLDLFSPVDKVASDALAGEHAPVTPTGVDAETTIADLINGFDKQIAEKKGAMKSEQDRAASMAGGQPQDIAAAKKSAGMRNWAARQKLQKERDKLAAQQPQHMTQEEHQKARDEALNHLNDGEAAGEVLKDQGLFDEAPLIDAENVDEKAAQEAEKAAAAPPVEPPTPPTPPAPPAAGGAGGGEEPPSGPLAPGMNPATGKPYTLEELKAKQAQRVWSSFGAAHKIASQLGDPQISSFADGLSGILTKLFHGYDFTQGSDHPEEWFNNQFRNIQAAQAAGYRLMGELKKIITTPQMNDRIRKAIDVEDDSQRQLALAGLNAREAAIANLLHTYWQTLGDSAQRFGVLRYFLDNYFPHLVEFDSEGKRPIQLSGALSKSTASAISRAGDDYIQRVDGKAVYYRDVTWKTLESLQEHIGERGKVKTDVADVFGAHLNGMAHAMLMQRMIKRMSTDLEVPLTRGFGGRPIATQDYLQTLPPAWRDQMVRGGGLLGSAGKLMEGYYVYKPLAERIERMANLRDIPGAPAALARKINSANGIFKEYKFLSPMHMWSMMSNIGSLTSKLGYAGLPAPFDPFIWHTIGKGGEILGRPQVSERAYRSGIATPDQNVPEDMGPITAKLDALPPFKFLHWLTWKKVGYEGQMGLWNTLREQLVRKYEGQFGTLVGTRDDKGYITSAVQGKEDALFNIEKEAADHARAAMGFSNNLDMTKDWQLYGGALALANRWTTGQLRELGKTLGIKYLGNIGGGERFIGSGSMGDAQTKWLQQKSVNMSRRLVLGGMTRLLATTIMLGGAVSYLTTGQASTPIQNFLRDPAHTFDIYTGRDPATNRDRWLHMPFYLFQREMTDWALATVRAHQDGKDLWGQVTAPAAAFAGKINPITKFGLEMLMGRELSRWMNGYGNPDIDADKYITNIHQALNDWGVPDGKSFENRLIYAVRNFAPAWGFPSNLQAPPKNPGDLLRGLGPGTVNPTNPQDVLSWLGARTVQGTEYTTNTQGQEVTIGQAVQQAHDRTAQEEAMVQAAAVGDWGKVEQLRQQLNLTHGQMSQMILHGVTRTDPLARGLLAPPLTPPGQPRPAVQPKVTTVAGVKLTPQQEVLYESSASLRQDYAMQLVQSDPAFTGMNQGQKSAAYNSAIRFADRITNEQFGQILGARPGQALTDAQAKAMITEASQIQQALVDDVKNSPAYSQVSPEQRQAMVDDRINSVQEAVWQQALGNLKGATTNQLIKMIEVQAGVRDGVVQLLPSLPQYKNATDIYQQQQVESKALSYAKTMVSDALAGKIAGKGGAPLSINQIMPAVENGLVLQDAALNMLHQSSVYTLADAKTQETMDTNYANLAHRLALLDTEAGVDDAAILQQGFSKVLQSRLMADEGLQQLQDQYGGLTVIQAHARELADLKARFAQQSNLPPSKISAYDTRITKWYYAQNPDYAAYIKAHSTWISRNPLGQLYSALSKNELTYATNSPLNEFAPQLSI